MKFIKEYARQNNPSVAVDYVVAQKKEGKYLIGQILIYLFIAVAVLAVFIIPTFFNLPVAITAVAGMGLAVPVFWISYHGTRTICNFDRKYSIFTTNVTMDQTPTTVVSFEIIKDRKNKDGDTRNVVLERPVKSAELIAPWTEEYKAKYEGTNHELIDFRSSVKHTEDVYFAMFANEDGSKSVIVFETVAKVVEKFAYYNKEATVVAKLTR